MPSAGAFTLLAFRDSVIGATMPSMSESVQLHSLPLFPLGTVLYPDGILPLRIFEVRYLDMIGKCHRNGAPFGVVALTKGSEVRQVNAHADAAASPSGEVFADEAFNDVGTLATITALSRPQAGLMVVQCVGTQRIRINRREKLKHGLWVADVDMLEADAAVGIPLDLAVASAGLGRIIQRLQAQGLYEEQMPIGTPYRLNDCGWVANRWCELLQLPLELKQRLMALDNPLVRLELVRDILDQAGIAP